VITSASAAARVVRMSPWQYFEGDEHGGEHDHEQECGDGPMSPDPLMVNVPVDACFQVETDGREG